MKKLFKKIITFFYAFALLFCFAGCSIFPGIGGGSGSGGSGSGGSTGGGIGGSTGTIESDDPEFDVDEDGNFTYFTDDIASFDGVRILSVPKYGDISENQLTNEERERFFANVYTQFEVVAKFILYNLVGEFGSGISAQTIQGTTVLGSGIGKDYGGDYQIQIGAITPKTRYYAVGVDIFDSNEMAIVRVVSGWEYQKVNDENVLTPVYDNSISWNFSNGANDAETYVNNFKNFVQLRLMEYVLGVSDSSVTSWSDASNPVVCRQKLEGYTKQFDKLGFVFGDVLNSETVASRMKTFILDEIIGASVINYDNSQKTFIEPENSDGEYFDINNSGEKDTVTSEKGENAHFYIGYESIISSIITKTKILVDGEQFTDENQNGIFDQGENYVDENENGTFDAGFVNIFKMEVFDLASKDYFRPGTPETKESPRKLDNMSYGEYKSVVFFPTEESKYDVVDIYIDPYDSSVVPEWSMNIWLRVHISEEEEFFVPICTLNLDAKKSCDWANEKEGEDEDDFDVDVSEYFDDRKRNAIWLLDLTSVMTPEQYQAFQMVSKNTSSLDYTQRGHHTNSKDNLSLADFYKKVTFGESFVDSNGSGVYDAGEEYIDNNQNGKRDSITSLVYNGKDAFIEFIFEVVEPMPYFDYYFKFLITPSYWGIGDEEEEL